jgi:hypothetical protein
MIALKYNDMLFYWICATVEMTSFAATAFSSYISGDFPSKISVTLKPQINFPRHICVLKQRLVKTQKRRCSLKVYVARYTLD